MRTATVLSAVLAAGLSLGAATAEAQNSANIQATATVLSAVTVTAGQNLAFGNVTPGVNKTVAIADAGAGRFDVTKAANSRRDAVLHLADQPHFGREQPADRQLDRRLQHHRDARRRDGLHAERGRHQHHRERRDVDLRLRRRDRDTPPWRRSPGTTPATSPCRWSTSNQRFLPTHRPDAPVGGGSASLDRRARDRRAAENPMRLTRLLAAAALLFAARPAAAQITVTPIRPPRLRSGDRRRADHASGRAIRHGADSSGWSRAAGERPVPVHAADPAERSVGRQAADQFRQHRRDRGRQRADAACRSPSTRRCSRRFRSSAAPRSTCSSAGRVTPAANQRQGAYTGTITFTVTIL